MSRNRRGMIINKYTFIFIVIFFLPLIAFGQGDTPADGCDPYDGCPLDTWVYVLVFIAVIYGAYKLHKKQKSISF